jgi:hypothetical protein
MTIISFILNYHFDNWVHISHASITQFEEHELILDLPTDNNKWEDIAASASENELLLWNERKCTDRLVGHMTLIRPSFFP